MVNCWWRDVNLQSVRSLPFVVFYTKFPQWKFNVYFVAPVDSSKPTREERWNHCMTTPGCELYCNMFFDAVLPSHQI
jgi:hypothetical protein